MGDSGTVEMVDEGVFLYTHWGADELVDTVRAALARAKDRCDDAPYLARVIFCEMVKGDEAGTAGFGIQGQRQDDAWRNVQVDCEKRLVTVLDDDEKPRSFAFGE